MGTKIGVSTAVAVLLAAGLAAAQQVPGQVGYWTFENNYNDGSGQGVVGTPQGGPVFSPVVPPGLSFPNTSSLLVDGVDDWVDLGNPAAFPAGTAARSVAAWARSSSIGAGYGWIFAYGSPATSQSHFIGRNAATLFGGGYGDDVTVNTFWVVDVWHHIALTYDGTTARLYSDGLEVAMAAKTWNLVKTTARIGRQVNNAVEFWSGQIDEVRVYSRSLTQTEVAILAGGNPVPQNLQATAGVQQVGLAWTAPANAAQQTQAYPYTYTVLRSAVSGSGYTPLATGLSALNYVDTTATASTPYYYVVVAVSAAVSGNSAQATAIPLQPQPRVEGHDEGLFDGRCSCGSTAGAGFPAGIAGAALLLLALAGSRRRS